MNSDGVLYADAVENIPEEDAQRLKTFTNSLADYDESVAANLRAVVGESDDERVDRQIAELRDQKQEAVDHYLGVDPSPGTEDNFVSREATDEDLEQLKEMVENGEMEFLVGDPESFLSLFTGNEEPVPSSLSDGGFGEFKRWLGNEMGDEIGEATKVVEAIDVAMESKLLTGKQIEELVQRTIQAHMEGLLDD